MHAFNLDVTSTNADSVIAKRDYDSVALMALAGEGKVTKIMISNMVYNIQVPQESAAETVEFKMTSPTVASNQVLTFCGVPAAPNGSLPMKGKWLVLAF